MPLPENVQAVLLDIEGTTTPISFVYEVLFPYARERLRAAARRSSDDPRIGAAIEQLRREWKSENERGEFGDGVAYAEKLMDEDRKSTGLKMLQGLIWEEGYRSGTLRGQVFDDVPRALQRWRQRGVRVRVFSSGSVLAQKLLFQYSNHGDLSGYFEGHHDTTTGPKREARAYEAIARDFGLAPSQILFVSDVPEELDAAKAAGMEVALAVRAGNRPVSSNAYRRVETFDQLV